MKHKKYIFITISSIILILWAYLASVSIVTKAVPGEKFLPDLEKNISNIGTIVISGAEQPLKVRLENGQWIIADKYSYSVSAEKIRDLVQSSANITIIEKKTSNPDDFDKLGLDQGKEDNSLHIILLSADEKNIYADYVRGVKRKGVSVNYEGQEFYARLYKENQAYLVGGDIDFELSVNNLLGGETFAIGADKIKSVAFSYPTGHGNFAISRTENADFQLTKADGQSIKSSAKANFIAEGLEYINLVDVLPLQEFPVNSPEFSVRYVTFSGLVLDVNIYKYNENMWLSFAASGDAANQQSSEDAARINTLAANWVYRLDFKNIPGFSYRLEDLLKE